MDNPKILYELNFLKNDDSLRNKQKLDLNSSFACSYDKCNKVCSGYFCTNSPNSRIFNNFMN